MRRERKNDKLSWYDKLLLGIAPMRAMRRFAVKLGIKDPVFEKMHEAFAGTKRVDFFPSESGLRGFKLVIDRKTAIYFDQDGDHFAYTGFEMGEYEKGEVTILDGLRE